MINDSRFTPISEWNSGYEAVTLPSGKVVGMRPLDAFALLTKDGKIPQFLRANIERKPGKTDEAQGVTVEQTLETVALAELVIREGLVYPPIVESVEDERANKGVRLISIPMADKLHLLMWALGGGEAVSKAQRFPEGEKTDFQHLVE